MKIFIWLTWLVLSGYSCSGENDPSSTGELHIFHAGSLAVPFQEIAERFQAEHPGVKVYLEAAGSRTCARKITDLNRPCDVLASADYSVINTLLIPEHASWNIRFASNEMTIAYHQLSRMSDRIDQDNWYRILASPEVTFGRSEPDADPCGYRAVLTLMLAGDYYDREDTVGLLLEKDRRYIRPKETDLLALLEAGAVDYIFLYRSVAEQHHLKYLLLPDQINLKKEEQADYYGTAAVEISGKTPGSKVVKRGAPMVYGVTIPHNSPHPRGALAFVRFLLDEKKGMAIMEKHGQPSVIPAPSDTYEKIPDELKHYALPRIKE
ncbi:MAG: extracellular solute-binding protein [Candidatus Krumholzibacteriota bacterium]|nr:extracellular solute-binding protein [Candidatus Krumholzibacteriota bacterium]